MITDIAQALRLAETAGHVMLENGAETYRAEDTVIHVCRSMGLPDVQVLVIPTGIFLTLRDQGGQRHTSVIRVNRRSINLDSIHQANAIARRVGELSVQEAIDQLEALHTRPQYPDWLNTLSAALCSGFFALVFGGGALEFAIAAIAGLMAALLGRWAGRLDNYQVINSLFGGIVIAIVALAGIRLAGGGNLDAVIAGAVLPLLPGLAMTVAIRDTMRGDLVSGVARIAEALLVAACVAVGVGAVLGLWLKIGGTLS